MNTSHSTDERIIVIDDDEVLNETLVLILEDFYKVKGYYNAEEALKDVDITSVDVIIADVSLPGMDGIEFLKKIHFIDQDVPIIMITGLNDIDIAITALKNGAFDYIVKPFHSDQLLISVKRAIDRRKLLNENIKMLEELRLKNLELEILNKKMMERNLKIENELDIASNLQLCLFPKTFPNIKNIQFSVKYNPMEKISGDFYDFIIFDEDHFAIIFADVSGHGVPAALYSAMIKTAIGTVVRQDKSPSRFITDINSFLINSQKKLSYNYSTMFYGLVDLKNSKLSYCNAGIPSPAIITKNNDIVLLESNGTIVGIFESSIYNEEVIDIEIGDKFIFYTDGAFECTDPDDNMLGHREFIEFIKRIKTKSMQAIISDLFNEIENYSGNSEYNDDITILGMYYG